MAASTARTLRLVFFLTCLIADSVSALAPQTAPFSVGDVRSAGSGTWNSPSVWERYDGVSWKTAAASPDSAAGTITIRNGHTVTISAPLVYDQVVVEHSAQVVVAAGVAHVLSDGPGTDLTIDGVWLNQGGTWTVVGSARWTVTGTGIFIHNTTSGISTPLSKAILSPGSIFTYRGGPTLVPSSTFAGRTYGSLRFESSGGPFSITASGSTSLVIGGDLVIGGGVKWSTGGFTGNITVRGATVIEGEWGGSGTATLGVHTFEGLFHLRPSGKYTLSTSGAQSGPIVFKADLRCESTLTLPPGRRVEFQGSNGCSLDGPAEVILGGGAFARAVLSISQGATIAIGVRQKLVAHADVTNAGRIVGADSSAVLQFSDTCRMMTNNGSVLVQTVFDSTEPGRTVTGSGVWNSITVSQQTTVRFSGMHTLVGDGAPLVVHGSALFDDASSIKYQGIRRQEVSPHVYADLIIENGSDVVLGGPTTVEGLLEIRKGDLFTGMHALTLGAEGRLGEGASGIIVGRVSTTRRLNGANEESFGSIGFSIQAPASVGYDVTVTRRTDTAYALSSGRSLRRSFRIDGALALTGVRTTVRYRAEDLNGLRESHLELFGSRNDGANWIRLGGAVDTLSHTVTLHGDCTFPLLTIAEPFAPPHIVQLMPATAEQRSTNEFTIVGTGFSIGVSEILFSGTGLRGDAVEVRNDSCLVVRISIDLSAPPGARDIIVITPGGVDTLFSGLTITRAGNPIPHLLSIAPGHGARLATATIALHGSGFVEGLTTVSFGDGIEITSHVLDTGLLVVEARIDEAAGTGLRSVVVRNPGPGGGVSELSQTFMVLNPIPVLASINPQKLVRGESQEVIVLGSNFIRNETQLDLGNGLSVQAFEVESSTRMRALVKVEFFVERGERAITVWTPQPGGGRTTLESAIIITDPPPRVTSVTPQRLCRGSSTSVLLHGTGFVPRGLVLHLGSGLNVDSLNAVDSTHLHACITVADDALPGPRDLIIANRGPDGESSILRRALFVENPQPQIAGLNPSVGIIASKLVVVVDGAGLYPGTTSIDFGTGITTDSTRSDRGGKRIHAYITISDSSQPGQRIVKVANPAPGGGVAELHGSFTLIYPAPSLRSVRPASGGRGESLDLTLDGANFLRGATSVSMNPGVSVDSVSVLSSTQLKVRISISQEALIAARTIVVTNAPPGGGVARLNHVFNVENPLPRIVNVEPSILWRGERTALQIHGSGFSVGSTSVDPGADIVVDSILVAGSALVVLFVSVPAEINPGARDLSVTNTGAGGGRAVLSNAIMLQNPPPEADSLTPSVGLQGEASTIAVSGRRFLEGVTSLSLGEGIAIDYVRTRSRTLEAGIRIDGAAIPGPRDLTVTNPSPGGGTFVLRNAMMVRARVTSAAQPGPDQAPIQSGIIGTYPNPSNSAVTVYYGLAVRAQVRMVVLNILGVEVAQLVNAEQREGFYTISWKCEQIPSGVYFIQLTGDPSLSSKGFHVIRKQVILK